MDLKKFALNIYSFGLSAGFINKSDIDKYPDKKIDLDRICNIAKKNKLGGIEFPIDYFFNELNINEGIKFIKKTEAEGLSVFIDIEKLNETYLRKLIPELSALGHSSARIKMQHVGKVFYGGNRYLAEKFQESKGNFIKTLNNIVPLLEKFSFKLLIENHQDLSSLELVEIINSTSPEHIGINWDIGNSYSVLDTPDTFLDHAGAYIGNAHLKDYRIIGTSKGYRLVRCALGDGVIRFDKIIPKLIDKYNVSKMSIELGAQLGRECNINSNDYWSAYDKLPLPKHEFIEHIESLLSDDAEQNTLYEKGIEIDEVMQAEFNDVMKSINYLQSL